MLIFTFIFKYSLMIINTVKFYIFSNTCIYIYIYTHLFVYIYIYIYTLICIYLYTHICSCMHGYSYTATYVYIYIYVYICTVIWFSVLCIVFLMQHYRQISSYLYIHFLVLEYLSLIDTHVYIYI